MKGSEKQIKWAEDIKANLIKTYEAVIPMMQSADQEMLKKAIEKLNGIDHAGKIIEAYKGIRFSGNAMEDVGKIMACHKNMMPAELAQFMPV